jgi:hypothetical protein
MDRRTPPTTQGEEKQFQTLSPNRHWQRKPLKISMCHKTVQNLPWGVNLVAEQIHIPSGRTADNPRLFKECIDAKCSTIFLEKPGAPTVSSFV